MPYDWRTFGEYLDRIDGTTAVNAGFLVGHSAIRRCVMGDDAVGKPASEEQIDAMRTMLDESLASGGLGFSSSWARTHNDADGDPVPSRAATKEELIALCETTGQHEGTTLEFIPSVGGFEDEHLAAHVRHVEGGQPAAQLERPRAERRSCGVRVDRPRRGRLRGRARRSRARA